MKGLFITFEGIEGSGKSTQANFLNRTLTKQGIDCILTKEPGGTMLGEQIRQILLNTNVAPLAELLLFLADRNQHIHETIKPYLDKGFIVVCDRYYHSTYAYQSAGRGIGIETVRRFNEFAIEHFHPDITFFMDIPVETGFERKQTGNLQLDRIEREDRMFHQAVRESYLKMLGEEERMFRIDGSQAKEQIQSQILGELNRRFPALFKKPD